VSRPFGHHLPFSFLPASQPLTPGALSILRESLSIYINRPRFDVLYPPFILRKLFNYRSAPFILLGLGNRL
jgi:hypothetical protein